MIQFASFSNGGCVLHKVTVRGNQYSAWYNQFGDLLDAERKQGTRTYGVPARNRLVREELTKIGKRHRPLS